MSFKSDISKFTKKVEKNANNVFKATALQIFGRIIKMSPVGNPSIWKFPSASNYVGGRFRNNWNTNIGSPDLSANRNASASGKASTSEMRSESVKVKIGDVIYMTNNLPYAERLENGWSSQAPIGMVKTTIARYKKVVAANARKVNK